MMQVNHLSVAFPGKGCEYQEVVRDISFSLHSREITAIIGESGSGKTMTALGIMGLLPPGAQVSGEILFEGNDLLKQNFRERRKIKGNEIAMIFQEPMSSLNPVMKIGKQVEEPLLLHGNDKKDKRKSLAIQALALAGLKHPEDIYHSYPHQLSGGMRQRVMIAMAMVNNPKLIVADEPTTALDVKIQEQILELLKRINRERGMGILFISHNLGLVRSFCDRVLVMYQGQIVETGTPEEIFTNPQDAYTKKLLSSVSEGNINKKKKRLNKKPVLSVEHLNVWYPGERKSLSDLFHKKKRHVVKDVSFTIDEGEIVGLIGESGCGKSTLSKAVLGLLSDVEGRIIHDTKYPQMVFQDPYGSLNPSQTIGWILEEPLRIQKKLNSKERAEKVCGMLEKVGLDKKYKSRRPDMLSGGERQRVGIALSLILGSKFIIADEPVSALDATIQEQILTLLKELKEEFGLSYLLISHDMAVISRMCDRVLEMQDGYLKERKEN